MASITFLQPVEGSCIRDCAAWFCCAKSQRRLPERRAAAQVLAVVALQCVMAWAVRDMAWWKVVALAYLVGGTASQNLFCAQHELSHFLAHRRLGVNRALSLISNCPLVVPMATAFRKYHQEHHSHLVRPRCRLRVAQFVPSRACAWRRAALQDFCEDLALFLGLEAGICVVDGQLAWAC